MDKSGIRRIILDQRETFEKKSDIVSRAISEKFLRSKKISVISGIRRSGKSTLLKQIANNLDRYAYVNFEDERMLRFTYRDFGILLETFLELYGTVAKRLFLAIFKKYLAYPSH